MPARFQRHFAATGIAALTLLTTASLAFSGATMPTAATPQGTTQIAAATRSRPNIVVIMLDDARDDDLGFMPLARRLIRKHGVRFKNSFSPFSLCCPARASVLTGRYTHNHRVFDVVRPYGFNAFNDRSTLATWLKSSGYATVYVGKYLNGYGYMPPHGESTGDSLHYVPPGWSRWRASIDWGLPPSNPRAGGTYQYFDTTLSRNGEGFVNYQGRYQTRVYGDLTEEIIAARAPSSQPFFLYMNYTAPHHGAPVEPDDPGKVRRDDGVVEDFGTPARPADVKGMFDARISAAPGADWRDPDFGDKPHYLRRLPVTNRAERRAMRTVTRQRAEALWVVDRQIKRTVDALRKAGELGNTFIVVTSDNGYFLGEQRMRQGKIYPHEPSLRVPFLMRGPGIPAGQTRHDPIASIDIAPTLARAAGVAPPKTVDGESLLAVARHGDRGWSRAFLTETGPMLGAVRNTNEAGLPLSTGGQRDTRYLIGVRTQRYLFVDVATGARELYDLKRDPEQYVNLIRDSAYGDVRKLLRHELTRLRACDGADCQAPMSAALLALDH
jgi:arylsulfatase A-like enzyme